MRADAEGYHGAVASDEDILGVIGRIAAEHVDYHGPLDPAMRLAQDLELDSIKLLTLTVEIENHFRIRLDETDEAEIATVADLMVAIEKRIDGRDDR